MNRLTLSILFALSATPVIAATHHVSQQELIYQLRKMSSAMRYDVASLWTVLDRYELEEFFALRHDGERREWIDNYWKQRDPTRTTDENEARDLHDERTWYSETHFRAPKWPGFDHRGELYIRFGAPDAREVRGAELLPSGHVVRAHELWHYDRLNMTAKLEDAYGDGVFTLFMEHIEASGSPRDRKGNQDIEGNEIQRGPNDLIEMSADEWRARFSFSAMNENVPVVYPFDLPEFRIPVHYSVESFRDTPGNDRVDVSVQFLTGRDALPEDAPAHLKREAARPLRYEASAVFWNTSREEVARMERTLDMPAGVDRRWFPLMMTGTLPPDFYHGAVTVKEMSSGKFTSFSFDTQFEDYERHEQMSDVIMASKIDSTVTASPFTRGGIEVVPHPMRRYLVGEVIPLYFEIYRNDDIWPRIDFSIEYRVISKTPRKQSLWDRIRGKSENTDVGSTFAEVLVGDRKSIDIGIGTRTLWPGTFELVVAATNEKTGLRSERRMQFELETRADREGNND